MNMYVGNLSYNVKESDLRQDIKIDAPVSSRLRFNVHNTLQPIWQKVLPESKIIKVSADSKQSLIGS